ncbi:MAG: TIGR01777 family oxidoreductase [Cytophagaceae bacterium]
MKVLITGGSGLVGRKLTELLLANNISVVWLSRHESKNAPVPTFVWNYDTGELDPNAMVGVTHIVHLAGAGVFDKKWTEDYKKEIMDSRVKSAKLLHNKATSDLKVYVSASAIGWYGADHGDRILTETDPNGIDFLAEVTKHWEAQADQFSKSCRVVKIRIGIVMAKEGGALPMMVKPVKFGVGTPLGKGNQYMSWVHIDDLAHMFYQGLIQESWSGVYNACAPNPVTNAYLTQTIAKKLHKKLWLPNVPEWVLKIMFGNGRTESLLGSLKVSSQKVLNQGFVFKFNAIEEAIENLS